MQTVDSRLITLCHCMFLKCNEHTTLVGGMLIMGEAMHVVGRWGGVWLYGKFLYFPSTLLGTCN